LQPLFQEGGEVFQETEICKCQQFQQQFDESEQPEIDERIERLER